MAAPRHHGRPSPPRSAVAQELLGAKPEHHWLRLCYARPGHLFPYLPTSPPTTAAQSRRAGGT
jgi:hypothetical protein